MATEVYSNYKRQRILPLFVRRDGYDFVDKSVLWAGCHLFPCSHCITSC